MGKFLNMKIEFQQDVNWKMMVLCKAKVPVIYGLKARLKVYY